MEHNRKDIPINAETHIQNNAPGPPRWMAVPTPAKLPTPVVAAKVDRNAFVGPIRSLSSLALSESLEKVLKNIDQFPQKKFFDSYNFDQKIPTDTIKFWIKAQEKINQDKKLKFFKTHNAFGKLNNFDFKERYEKLRGKQA